MVSWRCHLLVVLYVLLIAGLYAGPIFGPGIFIAGDNPFYLSVAQAVDANLWERREFLGWSFDNFAGFPVPSLFLPAPLGFLVLSLLHGTTPFSLASLYKGLVVFSLIFPALALWVLLAKRFSRVSAFVGVNLYLLSTYHVIQPLQGMWAHYLGLGMFIVLLNLLDAWLNPGLNAPRAICLVLLILGTILIDAFTWLVLLLAVPLSVIVRCRRKAVSGWPKAWASLLLVSPIVLVGGWTAILYSNEVGWGVAPVSKGMGPGALLIHAVGWLLLPGAGPIVLQDIAPTIRHGNLDQGLVWVVQLLGEHLPEGAVVVLFILGCVLFARRGRMLPEDTQGFLRQVLLLAGLFLVLLGFPWQALGPAALRTVMGPFQQEWFISYVNVCLLVVGSYAVHEALQHFAGLKLHWVILLCVSFLLLYVVRYSTYFTYVPVKTSDQSVLYSELAGVWAYIADHVDPSQSRVMFEELEGVAFLDGGRANVAALAKLETGVNAISNWTIQTNASFRQPLLAHYGNPFASESRTMEVLRMLNCSHLVVWHPLIRQRLLDRGEFEIVHESHNKLFSVLKFKSYVPSWIEFDRTVSEVRTVATGDRKFVIAVDNPSDGNSGIFKMAYHPRWHMQVNDAEGKLVNRQGLVGFSKIPAGTMRMTFSFR